MAEVLLEAPLDEAELDEAELDGVEFDGAEFDEAGESAAAEVALLDLVLVAGAADPADGGVDLSEVASAVFAFLLFRDFLVVPVVSA